MKPKVSIIMVNYNGDQYIQEAIQSIISQTFSDFELLIFDDNSNDSSKKIIKEFEKKDKRIRAFLSSKKTGQVQLRNKALKKAKGTYIAVLDSDDVSLKNRLVTQYLFLEKNPQIFLCGSSAIKIDENGKEIGKFRKYQNSRILSWRLPKSNGIIHSSIMFRNQGELYDEKFKYCQDYDFHLRLLKNGKKLINISRTLVKYRFNPKSISFTKKKEQKFYRDKAIEEYKKDQKPPMNKFNINTN